MLVTLPKKGDLTECKNYRTIALTSHMGKILMSILLNRLKVQTEEYLADEQAGFRRDRSTIQQILLLRLIAEKASRNSKIVYNCFVDFQKAFDSIKLDIIWATLRSYGVGKRLVQILRDMGERSKMAVKVGHEVGEWFTTTIGTRQGDPISPNIFITYLERVMDVIQDNGTGISVQGEMINNLRYAVGMDLLEESCVALQNSVKLLSEAGIDAGLRINIEKTKTMIFGGEDMERQMEVLSSGVGSVGEFVYLGGVLTWDDGCSRDVGARINKAKGVMAGFGEVWGGEEVKYSARIDLVRACVFSVALYACETWTLRKADRTALLVFEMYCYRWILHVKRLDKIRNSEIRRRLLVKEDLVEVVMRRKLSLFGD